MTSVFPRTSRAIFRNPAIAAALLMGGFAATIAPAMAAQEAAQEEQPKITPSKDFQKPYLAVKEQFDAVRARPGIIDQVNAVMRMEGDERAAARAELAQSMTAEIAALRALKDKINNQSDRYIWGYYASQYGVLSDNPDLRLEGIVEEGASGLQTTLRKAEQANAKGIILFDRGEYAGARQAFEQALDFGSTDRNIKNNIAVTYLREDDRSGALTYYSKLIDEQSAAGKPTEDLLIRAYQLARELGVDNANEYAFNLVRNYPRDKNWANAILLVRDSGANLPDEAVLDLQRLMLRTDSIQQRYDITTLVSLADARKRPQEVMDAIDAGVAAGLVEESDPLIVEARKEARAQIKIDETELASLDRDARAAGAAVITPTVAGDAFLNYGQPAKAEELYRIALKKPGANVSMLMTRIGIAQLDQGRYEDARTTFAEITGQRAPVAALWRIYSEQQGS